MLSRLPMTRLVRSEISLLLFRVRVEASTTFVGRAEDLVLRSTFGRYILISLLRLLLLRADPGLSTFAILLTVTLLPVERSMSDLRGPPT
ncbi:hypothetical protein D3C71_1054950 [compost metagenome]